MLAKNGMTARARRYKGGAAAWWRAAMIISSWPDGLNDSPDIGDLFWLCAICLFSARDGNAAKRDASAEYFEGERKGIVIASFDARNRLR